MTNLDPENIWLRFFLRRLLFASRNAKSAEVQAVLQELIEVAQERLDSLEHGTDSGHAPD